MNPVGKYIAKRDAQVRRNLNDKRLLLATRTFTKELVYTNYTKNFTYLGLPIIQYPSDLMVMQELIWQIRPSYIIETGVAFGGSLLFYANILKTMGKGLVFGVEVALRPLNRMLLEGHPLYSLISLIDGSSIDKEIVENIRKVVNFCNPGPVLVVLDSNHTHAHVLEELQLYSSLVSVGSYVVVFDTAIQFFGHLDREQDRPWGVDNNPWTAVQEFLKVTDSFIVDSEVEQRALITAAPGGWLKRVK